MMALDELKPLVPVVPVFILIAIGFCFARYKRISLEPITEIVVYLGAPCLVFTSLATKPLFSADIAAILAGALGIVAGVGLLVWLYGKLARFRSPAFTLPALFMNAGNMGIPLALFAFGEPGLQRGTLFYVIATLLHHSLGLYLLCGKGGWVEVFRLPLIYAAVAGLLFNVAQIRIPEPIFQPLSLLGYSVIPLMLLSLGYRLHDLESVTWGHSVAGALIRVVGGFAAAYATVAVLGIDGINRQVILLYGSLPSAVINYVLTAKYTRNSELTASIIVLSTILSLATVPFVFWLIR
jgi:predicted permease